jgi:hypothetical protein
VHLRKSWAQIEEERNGGKKRRGIHLALVGEALDLVGNSLRYIYYSLGLSSM